MNEPSVIQSQQAKWMEVILVCLGLLIPLRFGPVVYQYLKWSNSTPEILLNSLGGLLLLTICIGLFLQYRSLSPWILKAPYSSLETSTRDSELSGWLTIGIFAFGLLLLVHTIPLVLYLLGDMSSHWFSPNQEALTIINDKMWYYVATFGRDNVPQITVALFLTIFPQTLAKWTMSLQKRWGPLNAETPMS